MKAEICNAKWLNKNYDRVKASDPNLSEAERKKHNHKFHICHLRAPHLGNECTCIKCMEEWT